MTDQTEIENMLRFDGAINSNAVDPRWLRKQKAQQNLCSTPTKVVGDRFIPNRSNMNLDVGNFNLTKQNSQGTPLDTSPAKEMYKSKLSNSLFEKESLNSKILSFKGCAAPESTANNRLNVLYSTNNSQKNTHKSARHIAQAPERILDAPDLMDDYYLNLLDWSSQNILAIALGPTVFMWNATTSEISELCTLPDPSYVSSISFIGDGNYLAVGTSEAEVQIFDVTTSKQLRRLGGHQARVGALDWNNHLLSSGSRDTSIINHDVRIAEHVVNTFQNHTQEVCGLKWNQDGTLLGSGGNDNLLNIWDINASNPCQPKFTMNHHTAAVKALAWCPFQSNLLATGGGTVDRMLRFWNTTTGACLNAIDTKSQVCSIVWSKNYRELVTSHGFTQNQLTVWNYPSMTKVTELTGHQSRVLHMAQSPDGETVVSAAGDETLRFWKIFEKQDKPVSKKEAPSPKRALSNCSIR